jgi:hypothetical protein
MINKIKTILILLLAVACVEPYDIKKGASAGMLVVEAVFSNQLKRHQVFLSRATSLDDRRLVHEQGATVTISDEHNNVISLSEETPGVYETPECAAQVGSIYTLHIQTPDGREYTSTEVPFKNGPDIGQVYAKYINKNDEENKGLAVYVDTEDPSHQTNFYRWNYIETYEVHAPFPSNWIWLGNNQVEFRHQGIDTCYVTDTLRNIIIRNTTGLEQDKITGQLLRFIPATSYISRYRYSILVQQFALSAESYLYWENLRTISEQQGSLSDIQPGSIPGNIVSLTDSDEAVLGYFDASHVSEKRIFFAAINFYNEGFLMPENLRSNCYEISPILVPQAELDEAMTRYERTMYIWEVYGFEPFATFELMPKSCCDCRDLGPTKRPSFF